MTWIELLAANKFREADWLLIKDRPQAIARVYALKGVCSSDRIKVGIYEGNRPQEIAYVYEHEVELHPKSKVMNEYGFWSAMVALPDTGFTKDMLREKLELLEAQVNG